MNRGKTKLLIATLKSIYEGPAWHGPSIIEVLQKLDSSVMLNATPNSHNLVEIIEHMTAWRTFALKKLEKDAEYTVSDEANFKQISTQDEATWNNALKALDESQKKLLAELEKIDDDLLKENVPGSKYTFYFLLHGIVHHDAYHLGQIILLAKQ
jgi:uncharacterized damage-inducible protein DinB